MEYKRSFFCCFLVFRLSSCLLSRRRRALVFLGLRSRGLYFFPWNQLQTFRKMCQISLSCPKGHTEEQFVKSTKQLFWQALTTTFIQRVKFVISIFIPLFKGELLASLVLPNWTKRSFCPLLFKLRLQSQQQFRSVGEFCTVSILRLILYYYLDKWLNNPPSSDDYSHVIKDNINAAWANLPQDLWFDEQKM